jgi:hypothetical protein
MAEIKCVLVRWDDPLNKVFDDPSALEILNHNAVILDPDVQGLDPDLEYFVKREPYPYPDVDYRLQAVTTTEWVKDEFDTEYPTLRKWEKIYQTASRTDNELKTSVDSEEQQSNATVFPNIKQFKYLALYVGIVRREANGLNISAAQQDIIDKVEAKLENMWINHVNALSKKADIDASNPIDLDSGWNTTDPENV